MRDVRSGTTSTTPRGRLNPLLVLDNVDGAELSFRWNVAASQPVYAVTADRRSARTFRVFRWATIPHWSADTHIASRLIGARKGRWGGRRAECR